MSTTIGYHYPSDLRDVLKMLEQRSCGLIWCYVPTFDDLGCERLQLYAEFSGLASRAYIRIQLTTLPCWILPYCRVALQIHLPSDSSRIDNVPIVTQCQPFVSHCASIQVSHIPSTIPRSVHRNQLRVRIVRKRRLFPVGVPRCRAIECRIPSVELA